MNALLKKSRLVRQPRRAIALLAICLLGGCDRSPLGPYPTMELVWKVPGAGFAIQPSFDYTTVYFGGVNHELVAVDKTSGLVRWRAQTATTGSFTWGVNVLRINDVVVLPDVDAYAYDPLSGELKYVAVPDLQDGVGYGHLTTDGQTIFAPSRLGKAYALDPATGNPLWTTVLTADTGTRTFRPTAHNGNVYIGFKRFRNPATGALVALASSTGAILWTREFLPTSAGQYSGCFGQTVFHGGNVIVAVEDGSIYALNELTGDEHWKAPRVQGLPPDGPYNDHRPLAISREVVIAGSDGGIVVGLNAQTGEELWRNTDHRASMENITADDRYVYLAGGKFEVLDAQTGKTLWATSEAYGAEVYYDAPAVDGEMVYVSGKGGFYAFRRKGF